MQNHHQNPINNLNNPLQLESEQVTERQLNTYVKYCPNVWLAKCSSEHQKGEIIKVANVNRTVKLSQMTE